MCSCSCQMVVAVNATAAVPELFFGLLPVSASVAATTAAAAVCCCCWCPLYLLCMFLKLVYCVCYVDICRAWIFHYPHACYTEPYSFFSMPYSRRKPDVPLDLYCFQYSFARFFVCFFHKHVPSSFLSCVWTTQSVVLITDVFDVLL